MPPPYVPDKSNDKSKEKSGKIFCALDTNSIDQAKIWARDIAPVTGAIKFGMEFFNAHGPQGVIDVLNSLNQSSQDNKISVFLDLKYHDIPNTVAGAVRSVTTILAAAGHAPAYLNIHCGGGPAMMRAAKDACPDGVKLLGVTMLTSIDQAESNDIGFSGTPGENAIRLAKLAEQCGLDGVVCSALEIAAIRQNCTPEFETMVPGIRPAGSATNDQRRVMSPDQAFKAGATNLVIGRPITASPNPGQTARDIIKSCE